MIFFRHLEGVSILALFGGERFVSKLPILEDLLTKTSNIAL